MSGLAENSVALDGAEGKVFRVDPEGKRFELLKETEVDPKTHEGRSRHTVYWTEKTRFVRVDRQNSFAGLSGDMLASIRPLSGAQRRTTPDDPAIVTLDVTILAPGEDGADLKTDASNLLATFRPDPQSEKFREGHLIVDGQQVPLRLRGPHAKVNIRSTARAEDIAGGLWETTIHGRLRDERFVIERMDIRPRLDPRTVDDPNLPRILVVGDSISMNYHNAAKKALDGVANYYRVEGNGGPSDRGVVCMDLWLGDYTQPGLQWDMIQFNHGLHDLKQVYNKDTGEYGAYQVPVEEYKANLEKEIRIMKKTGAVLVWCSTTPVPNDSFGTWSNGTFGRRRGAADLYNRAALEVVKKHPEIYINDLHRFITETEAFDAWRQQKDVHFWDGKLQAIVGQAVADRLKEILKEAGSAEAKE